MMKGKFDDDDGIDLADVEKFLPGLRVSPPQCFQNCIHHCVMFTLSLFITACVEVVE